MNRRYQGVHCRAGPMLNGLDKSDLDWLLSVQITMHPHFAR